MKNYNKILEAINRGIKFALDDFEDQDDIQGQINSKVNHVHGTKEWLNLMGDVVDLGLPSGTLWCKYNLDVNSNQLSRAEDWYGKYYAWGELEANKTDEDGEICFNWSNYKFGKEHNKLTKYCNDPKLGLNGFTDNLTKLLPEDDVAYQNKKLYDFKFHIPTKEQCKELINYTNNYWVYNYDPNKIKHNPEDDKGIQGLNGMVFEGKNRKQLFIPAAGCCDRSDIFGIGKECHLWSSGLCLNDSYWCDFCYAYILYFDSSEIRFCGCARRSGCGVRPVLN